MGVEVKGAGDGVVIAERGLCDLGYKTNSDIRDSRDQRDQNIINQVVAALKTTGGTTTA